MNKLIVLVLLSELSLSVPAHIGLDFHAKVKVSDKVRNFIRNVQHAAQAGYAAYQENLEVQQNPSPEEEKPTDVEESKVELSNEKSEDDDADQCIRSGGRNCKNDRANDNKHV